MILIGILSLSLGSPILVSNQTHNGKLIYTQLGVKTNQTLEKLLYGLLIACGSIIMLMIIGKTGKINKIVIQTLVIALLLVLVSLGGMIMALSIKIITTTNHDSNAKLMKSIPNLELSMSQVYLTLSDGILGIIFGLTILGSAVYRLLDK
jgi:hypothetical protein